MRFLKRLQLHGYKSFAARTEFLFDAGITAIVGPNGSGKSNIADALRWVLGEQSYSALRGKRTEDMIFSGSEQRPRLGMAHVSVVLDNSSHWLPIEFAEVEIGRRAYRSGENEYFLNGNRVRLRDITELLASSGLSERTYTVVGQGLVDQALSLRPEERRRLFEEAAGITVHQSKREQAVQKLTEARVNLTRAQDIINELTPRLRYLKGQARRAQEYQQIKADLEEHLRIWYGYRWRQALETQAAAEQRAAELARVTAQSTDELNAFLAHVGARRAERAELVERLSAWHRASSTLHSQADAIGREVAVRQEQARLWGEQHEELETDLERLRAILADGADRLAAAQADYAAAQAGHQAQHSALAEAEQNLKQREEERRAQAQRLARIEEQTLATRTRLSENRSRLRQIEERRAELDRIASTQATAIAAAVAQLAELETAGRAQAEQLAARQAELDELERERNAANALAAQGQAAERQATAQLQAAQRTLARLQDQRDLLARLRDEGTGLSSGVRAVLAAARSAEPTPLHGIVGALGDLLEVPAELERAIEAALGARVQDVVVERWADAEAAVAYLKQHQAGRATFLPLDTLRPGQAARAPSGPGVLGVATELVRYAAEVRPAVELALNHVIVVQDLPTARRLLSRERGATLVTLEGDIVRPGGSVTGGSEARGRDSGVLARSRALRELPAQIAAAAEQVRAAEAAVAQAQQLQATARSRLETLRGRRDAVLAAQSRISAEINRLTLAAERARQTRAWHEEQQRLAAQERLELDARETNLRTEIARLEQQLAEGEASLAAGRRALAELAADDLLAEVARLRAEVATSAGRLQSHATRVEELRALQRNRAEEIATRERRCAALSAQRAEAIQAIAEKTAALQALSAQIAALNAQIEPAEAKLQRLDREQREAETREQALREQLRHAQARQNQADLALQRARDDLARLRGEIEKELGLVSLAPTEGWAAEQTAGDEQPPLPLNGMVTRLPAVAELPEGLDDDVRRLRAQLARLGPVNLEALAEYQEVDNRYNFLMTQAADLQQAVTSLEEVIAELDRVMEREFLTTFKAVAAHFREEFKNLFGGGSAKLELSDPDNPSTTGVEIVARPPGKREQGLALLSGGERALTAAALIFSILRARPTPFCVLDEVDAALDEANVGRFREALKGLSAQTQFILITHNRGTIEVADTLYGISMGADHTSQALSLRLENGEIVPVHPLEE